MNPIIGRTRISLKTKTPKTRIRKPINCNKLNFSRTSYFHVGGSVDLSSFAIGMLKKTIQTSMFLARPTVVLWAADPYLVIPTPVLFTIHETKMRATD